MKRALILLSVIGCCSISFSQPPAVKEIFSVLDNQVISWNNGNIHEFMNGYWNDDSLMFVGRNGIRYGYENVEANYKKAFPDTVAMGRLSYDILKVIELSPENYFVAGKFTLVRTIGNLQGYFTLVFRKINGRWLIVSDHSS